MAFGWGPEFSQSSTKFFPCMNQEICSNAYIISMVLSPTAVLSILCIADTIVASLKQHITQVCCSFIRKYQIKFNLAQE